MRQQPLIGTVTLIGTALAIFLIMIVVMLQEVKVAPIAPESNRDRFLHACFFHQGKVGSDDYGGSGSISYNMARRLYGGLENTDTTAYYNTGTGQVSVNVHGKSPIRVDLRGTDEAFWRVFDFTFLAGKNFTNEDLQAGLHKAVVSESVARELFGTTDAVGREFYIDHFDPYTVVGVVKDVPTVTSLAYAQIWTPLTKYDIDGWNQYMGPIRATILAKDRSDFPAIKAEVKRRVEALNSELKSEGTYMVDHDAPYPQEALQALKWSNVTPNYEQEERQRWMVYGILLLIPAINLSSMTQSRLRRRVSEIGVRRAFGCTRFRIIRDILGENLLITLAGGVLGFILSVVFAWLASDLFFTHHSLANADNGLTPMMLLNGNVFLFALGFCFVLNLLTAGIPALRASRLNPVEAIGGMQK